MVETVIERRSIALARPAQEGRTYLAVPYAEKNEAKALGAEWDGKARSCYLPAGIDPARFARWSLERAKAAADIGPVEEFAAALATEGPLLKGAPLMDGRLHRVPVEGDKPGRRSGAYAGYLDGHCPGGYLQNFKSGAVRNWKSKAGVPALSAADRARLMAESAARRAERGAEAKAIHADTVRLVGSHIADCPPASIDHPYLAAKGVGAHGIALDVAGPLAISGGRENPQRWSAKGNLIVPIRNIHGDLVGAQSIDAVGGKSFPRGARWLGGMHLIGGIGDSKAPLVVAEGYATGAAIHEATGLTVAVAFNAGNMEAVATALRDAHPDARIIIAGDDDHQRERELLPDGRPKPNPGRQAAEKVAAARLVASHSCPPLARASPIPTGTTLPRKTGPPPSPANGTPVWPRQSAILRRGTSPPSASWPGNRRTGRRRLRLNTPRPGEWAAKTVIAKRETAS